MTIASTVTLSDASPAGSNEGTLTAVGSGPALVVKTLVGGANVTIDNNADNVTISASGGGGATDEALSVASGASVNPSLSFNNTRITTTGTSGGTATGTLANGLVDNFVKTIALVSSPSSFAVQYVLTVNSCVNRYGITGVYVYVLQQAGMSVAFNWDADLAAWIETGYAKPTTKTYAAKVSLDPPLLPPYSTGTVSQSGTSTVTGMGTAFVSLMVGGTISYPTPVTNSTGTASQVLGTFVVTGTSTTFIAIMVNGTITYADGNTAGILTVDVSAQTMTVDTDYSESDSTFVIAYNLPSATITNVNTSAQTLTVSVDLTFTDELFLITMPQVVRAVSSDNAVLAVGSNAPNSASGAANVINAALSYVYANGGSVFISDGAYYIPSSEHSGHIIAQGTQEMPITITGSTSTTLIGIAASIMVIFNYVTVENIRFDTLSGFTNPAPIGNIYFGATRAIMLDPAADVPTCVTVRHCCFNLQYGVVGQEGNPSSFCVFDGNYCTQCRGGFQTIAGGSQCMMINNRCLNAHDDTLHMIGAVNGIIANNYVDMAQVTRPCRTAGDLL